MGTSERRLAIMKYICRKRHTTMPDLAKEFGVSVKTIQRDIFELSFLMPLYSKCGRHEGGIYVDNDYTMDRMYMSPDELMLLIKVKQLSKNVLSGDELTAFERIIHTYTKPTSIRHSRIDPSCSQSVL